MTRQNLTLYARQVQHANLALECIAAVILRKGTILFSTTSTRQAFVQNGLRYSFVINYDFDLQRII